MNTSSVNVWKETVVIPTYGTGMPDKNPMFFENRVYQGSSGVVYPHPVIESVCDEKQDREYIGLFLENEYLKILILPELGGRVQMAFDKIKGRHFVYYNQVIKPALVGLCGPWISGGIEFNWPQHHRPSTFEPVDFALEENKDGSKTILVNEVERMFGTKATAAFVLHPGKAYLEINVKLFNRTPLPQTFLWWANPAVKVNDDYQSVFPPDVNAVFDHGKRDVSQFPIATGTYYKVNYAPGTDISRYKNIPVPTSYMAIHSSFDFLGGYEHDTQAGVLHVADHHVSPGKKQWTWGHGDFGKAWDRNLTDEDGPYVELMAGVFTDNQPDFSWLMPFEEKTFTQYFLPYRELGVVKNATKDILVNVECGPDALEVKVFATSAQTINVRLFHKKQLLMNETVLIGPETVFIKTCKTESIQDQEIAVFVFDENHKEVLRYQPAGISKNETPEPAKPALAPAQVQTTEQLYLTALHLEQYRHATYSPVPYYEEALRRDPTDIRNNNGLGCWHFRKGKFLKSEGYFRKAIETITAKNSNPYNGESFYNLGLSLQMQGKNSEAYQCFYKACWNDAWKHAGFFSLAQLNIANKEYAQALQHIDNSLERNAGNSKACSLKVTALRKTGNCKEALVNADLALDRDRFNLSVYFEKSKIYQLLHDTASADAMLEQLSVLARKSQHNYMEFALDYAASGLYEEAVEFLQLGVSAAGNEVNPMVWYYLGWLANKLGNTTERDRLFNLAAASNPDYCFPNRLQDIEVLQLAINTNARDAKAPYYLGNLWYDKRQYADAMECWQLSAERDSSFATVYRNLGIAYYNKCNDAKAALNAYERAFALNTQDARVLMELDQLYKRLNKDPEERLSLLEQYLAVAESRDDLYLERISLINFSADFELAYTLIMQRKFHPWEGGEGKVSAQYCYSLVEMAKQQIHSRNYNQALALLEKAQFYPHNLGEGKLFGAQENDIFYWMACANEGLCNAEKANEYFAMATQGSATLTAAIAYNDQQPDKLFYQGLAWRRLGDYDKANSIFSRLIEYGVTHLNDDVEIDYFAVSLPDLLIFNDSLKERNRIHCHYLAGLGFLGTGELEKAKKEFRKGLQGNAAHAGCMTHLRLALQMEKSRVSAG